ncbi:MAG: family N-acetyltransferase [Bacteroidetes bacterium]|jgi:ribosomal-protein-alanine N-acetyltransferase|nr:family N-acetyltransferase [Bacteroidota bacterium]
MTLPKLNNDFKQFPVLTTERLILRKISKKDVNEIFFLRSDERMMTYVGRQKHKFKKESLEFIEMILGNEKRGESVTWAITTKDNPLLRGTICLWNIQKEHYRAELGYALHPDLQGKGIMHETVMAVLDYGFNSMRLHSVEAQATPANKASLKVLERAGFIKEGFFKENFFFDGTFHDTVVYSKIAP